MSRRTGKSSMLLPIGNVGDDMGFIPLSLARHPAASIAAAAMLQWSPLKLPATAIAMPLRLRLLLLLLPFVAVPAAAARAELQQFATAQLSIVTATGPHKFTVELATTPAQMEQGLMFRRSLAPDAGMLFDFKSPTPATMWMKNTLIPLDMLFVDARGRIVNIRERTVPGSLEAIAAAAPVRAVIELNGGTATRLGIRSGDRVVFPIFGDTR
jgi:uncharacterized protein